MQTNIKNKYVKPGNIICLCLFMLTASCRKLVDVDQPINSISSKVAFESDAQAASTVVGLYAQMINNVDLQWSNGAATIYGGLGSDEMANFGGTVSSDYDFFSNRLHADNNVTETSFWNPMYKTIYGANAIIDGIAASTSVSLTDSARKELIGESKFIRAFTFFYLTNLFGDIPLPLTSDFNKTALLPRTQQVEVYKQIIKDLIEAQAALPSDFSVAKNERIRPNKWAASAMLARVYLYQKDWRDAENQASLVISNNQFIIVNDLNKVFAKNSTEAIWQLEINNGNNGDYQFLENVNFIPTLSFDWSTLDQGTIDYLLDPSAFPDLAQSLIPGYYYSKDLISSFEQNDRRVKNWMQYTLTADLAPWTGDPIYYPAKYPVAFHSGQAIDKYYMVLRLAEQYLIRAEARAEQGRSSDAASDLNIIRSRAGLPPTTSATTQTSLLAAIAQERRVEFAGEWGHRWFDLKRTEKATAILGSNPSKTPFNATQLLWPIPQHELTTDPNVKQNPGY